MSDPAVEAAWRAGIKDYPPRSRGLAVDAACEALKPVRSKVEEWKAVLDDGESPEACVALAVIADISKLIYPSEELP